MTDLIYLSYVFLKYIAFYSSCKSYFISSSHNIFLNITDLSNQLDGGSWTELLTEKYFGSSDPYTGRITNGRWADTKVPYMTPEFLEAEGIDPSHTFFPVEESQW